MKGLRVIISGPSGAGKDTIAKKVRDMRPNTHISVSYTSRELKEGVEIDGVDYVKTSREEFTRLAETGFFYEYAEYGGNYYGTPRHPNEEIYESGGVVIFVINVDGAEKMKELFPDAVTIFVSPPSVDILRERLLARARESVEKIEHRIAIYESRERECVGWYDHVVVNDGLDDAVGAVNGIIDEELSRSNK